LILDLREATNPLNSVMAVFANAKPAAINPACIQQHREACRGHLARLTDAHVTAIGIRFPTPSDDPDVDFLARTLGRSSGERLYVNPNLEDCGVASRLGFATRQEDLAEFLSSAR
jgi:hypothetical protein